MTNILCLKIQGLNISSPKTHNLNISYLKIYDLNIHSLSIPHPFHVLGMYLPQGAVHIPAEFRGMGVRIEDDILITTDGYINLTERCPKHPDDIEAAYAGNLKAEM